MPDSSNIKQLLFANLLSCLLVFAGAGMSVAQELGKPFVRYYSPEEYNAGSYMYQAIQDERGVIYYANTWNIRVYDGVNWDYISLTNQKQAVSLAIDSAGVVFVGGNDEVGYLAPDDRGRMRYHSLLSEFPEGAKGVGRVYHTISVGGGIYFQAGNDMLYWNGEQGSIWHYEQEIISSFKLGDAVFVQFVGGGLSEFSQGSVTNVVKETALDGVVIQGLLPNPDPTGTLPLIATKEKGIMRFDISTQRFVPYQSEIQGFLLKNELRHATVMSDGSWAISTKYGGLLVASRSGELMCVVDKDMGLMDNQVNHIYEDKDGILWVSLSNGAAKVEINTPVTKWDESLGLIGHVNTIDRLNGTLVVGTNRGLFYLKMEGMGHADFIRIGGIEKVVYSSIQFKDGSGVKDDMLLLMDGGLYTLTETGAGSYKVEAVNGSPQDAYFLFEDTQQEGRVYALSSQQLYVLQKEKNQWQSLGVVKGLDPNIRNSIAEMDTAGNVWLVSVRTGVYRFRVSEDLQAMGLQHYGLEDGVPDYNFIGVDKVNEELLLTSEKGVYAFDQAENKFSIASHLGPQLADYYTGFYFFAEDPHGGLWYIAYQNGDELWRERAWRTDNGTYTVDSTSLRRIPVMDGRREGNLAEENGVAWFGGSDGLFRYESPSKEDQSEGKFTQGFSALIRSVTVGDGGEEIFGGTHFLDLGGQNGYIALHEQHETHQVELPYSSNSLVFHYASNSFFDEEKNVYSYKLENLGYSLFPSAKEGWSPWEKETKEHIRNLREGDYILKVRAKNIYGEISREDQISFTILPPWQRSLWAYVSYVLIGIGVIWASVRWNTRRLRLQKARLEQLVNERTARIARQKEEIEAQADHLKHANEEILAKNDVLAQQQEELLSNSEEIQRKNEMLTATNKHITDSINYAGRIQKALLGGEQQIIDYFDEAFVFLRPRDIVSGDFYWFAQTQKDGKPYDVILIAADCTGHGVPGAFMTVMGNALLNEIVNERGIIQPAEILSKLDEGVVKATSRQQNSAGAGSVNDGMDMSVVKISPCQKYVRYAGAKNPLYRVRNGEVEVFKGSKYPIGSSQFKEAKVFEQVDIDARPGDRFYIASDGYQDQFGGPEGRKFLRKRFRELLVKTSYMPMTEQKAHLQQVLEEWQGDQHQTDDILVVGFAVDEFR